MWRVPRPSGRSLPVIAVTCHNGEHFTVDPATVARVENDPDTVIHLVDGTKYVVADTLDHVCRILSEHASAVLLARKRLAGGVAELADHADHVRRSSLRVERRRYHRDGTEPGSAADRAVPPDTVEN
jgi:flagellar protein FlbD